MCQTFIAAILVDNRLHDAPKLQEILTKHGCLIKTRLGIHEAGSDSCSNQGLIILHMQAKEEEIKAFESDIKTFRTCKTSDDEIRMLKEILDIGERER